MTVRRLADRILPPNLGARDFASGARWLESVCGTSTFNDLAQFRRSKSSQEILLGSLWEDIAFTFTERPPSTQGAHPRPLPHLAEMYILCISSSPAGYAVSMLNRPSHASRAHQRALAAALVINDVISLLCWTPAGSLRFIFGTKPALLWSPHIDLWVG